MCIGLPMIVRSTRPGFATVEGRGDVRDVNTALVGDVRAGQWLLVFLDGARERIDAGRAAEVNAALDLLAGALGASPSAPPAMPAEPGFALPSALSAADVAAMTQAHAAAAQPITGAVAAPAPPTTEDTLT